MACDINKLNEFTLAADRANYFDKENGGLASAVIYRGSYVWESGSNREIAHGIMLNVAPMKDATWYDFTINYSEQGERRELWSWQRRFLEQKVEDARKELAAAKKELRERTKGAKESGSIPPSEDELKGIKKLLKVKVGWERKLGEVLDKLFPEPEEPTPEELTVMNKNRDAASSLLSSLQSIK